MRAAARLGRLSNYALLDLDRPEWGTCAIAYRYDQELFEPSGR